MNQQSVESLGGVETLLRRYVDKNQSVSYCLLSGNAGDALLNVGFFMLAKRIGLTYNVVKSIEQIPQNETVVFSGGGGLVETWGETVLQMVLRAADNSATVIVLPSSIHGNSHLLKILPENVLLFARDHASYDFASRISAMQARLELDHDMAFHIRYEELSSTGLPKDFNAVSDGKRLLRYIAFLGLELRGHCSKTVVTMRSDKEGGSKKWRHIRKVGDFSEACNFGLEDETRCFGTALMLVRLVSLTDSITTDRLHVGICGYLAGKEVRLIDSGYGKLRNVARFSMPEIEIVDRKYRNA